MNFDEIDMKILEENFDKERINQINMDNISEIFKYLNESGIYYLKDLFLTSLDLFLLPSNEFINKFEKLKDKLGNDYVDKLGEDSSLIEIMYNV